LVRFARLASEVSPANFLANQVKTRLLPALCKLPGLLAFARRSVADFTFIRASNPLSNIFWGWTVFDLPLVYYARVKTCSHTNTDRSEIASPGGGPRLTSRLSRRMTKYE
jgi:hypothetical protein